MRIDLNTETPKWIPPFNVPLISHHQTVGFNPISKELVLIYPEGLRGTSYIHEP